MTEILNSIKNPRALRYFFLAGALVLSVTSFARSSPGTVTVSEPGWVHLSQEAQDEHQIDRTRLIQLSLRSVGCQSVVISPMSLYQLHPSSDFKFSVDSPNCKVQLKAGTSCDNGYSAKNIPAYAPTDTEHTEDIGLNQYKVCILNANGSRSSAAGASSLR